MTVVSCCKLLNHARVKDGAVLSKCANPACGTKFQYLHTGKVFAVEYRGIKQSGPSVPRLSETRDRLRHFWLCSTCSQSLTIQPSGFGGVRIAPARSISHDGQGLAVASGEPPSNTDPVLGCHMQNAKRKLDALIKELEFLDAGGYRLAMGWRPPLVFEDSPICPKPPYAACPDARCVLLDFVPAGQRNETIPCRHIPLNQSGETLHTLYHTATMEDIENTLREWLKGRIVELKKAAVTEAISSAKTAA